MAQHGSIIATCSGCMRISVWAFSLTHHRTPSGGGRGNNESLVDPVVGAEWPVPTRRVTGRDGYCDRQTRVDVCDSDRGRLGCPMAPGRSVVTPRAVPEPKGPEPRRAARTPNRMARRCYSARWSWTADALQDSLPPERYDCRRHPLPGGIRRPPQRTALFGGLLLFDAVILQNR